VQPVEMILPLKILAKPQNTSKCMRSAENNINCDRRPNSGTAIATEDSTTMQGFLSSLQKRENITYQDVIALCKYCPTTRSCP
jgi:hypothetical protein